MANFAIAARESTIERANKVLEMYAKDGDGKKEDTLIRILEIAEREYLKGTHPEISDKLEDIDKTISILMQQIGTVVTSQDNQISVLTKDLDAAVTAKNEAVAVAEAAKKEADERIEAAEERLKKATRDIAALTKERDEAFEKCALLKEKNDYLVDRQYDYKGARAERAEVIKQLNAAKVEMAALQAKLEMYEKFAKKDK